MSWMDRALATRLQMSTRCVLRASADGGLWPFVLKLTLVALEVSEARTNSLLMR